MIKKITEIFWSAVGHMGSKAMQGCTAALNKIYLKTHRSFLMGMWVMGIVPYNDSVLLVSD